MQVRSRSGRLSSRSLVLWLMVGAASAGCAGADSGSGGTGAGGNSSASGGQVGTGGASGGAGAGGAVGGGGATGGTGPGGAAIDGGNGAGGATGAGGFPIGSGGSSSASGGAPGTGGALASGGSKGSAGAIGNGGTKGSGGVSASGGATGTGGASAAGGAGATGGTTLPSFCPPNAIFCADFEEASGVPVNHPVGTATFQDPTESGATFDGTNGVMALDTTDPYDGAQSLEVTPSSTVTTRSLAVAVPSTFWVRLYIRSDQAIGQTNENAFFGAGTSPTYRTGNYVALAEQFGCIFLDKSGTLYPVDQTCGANTPLAANVWHCIMAEFDGATGNVQVSADTTQIINASGWAPAKEAFNTFEFGSFADNPNGATVWYDDVAISSSPLTCP
jgi:hypothetical protein